MALSAIEILKFTKRLRDEAEEQVFIDALSRIDVQKTNLTDLLLLFSDDVPGKDALKLLANKVALFPVNQSIMTLVEVTPKLFHNATMWLELLYSSLLARVGTGQKFVEAIQEMSSDDKKLILTVLDMCLQLGIENDELNKNFKYNIIFILLKMQMNSFLNSVACNAQIISAQIA
jgi:hypothetical protein